MDSLWNLLSPPGSPNRRSLLDTDDPGDQLVAALVADASADQQVVSVNNQNYVEFEDDQKTFFDYICGCKVAPTGDLHFYVAWTEIPQNFDLILNDTPVHIEQLRHNDDAIGWNERFEKWVEQVRYQLPFETVLYWSDMESVFTVDATLSSWLESRGLSCLQVMLENNGCISIDMLSYLDNETLLGWGMNLLTARLILGEIQAMTKTKTKTK